MLQLLALRLPSELTQPTAMLGIFAGSNAAQRARRDRRHSRRRSRRCSRPATRRRRWHQQRRRIHTASAAAAPGKYTGEPISVNLKDVDLRDFFRLIHEISGLNVVLDPAVKGTLTIVLDEVPWDQALDIVLQNNGLDKQLQRQRAAHRYSRHHEEGSGYGARPGKGAERRHATGDRDSRAELRQGHDT